MARAKKLATGATRMRQLGYLPVKVWFKRDALNAIAECANKQGKPLATWIREAAHAANDRQRDEHFYG